MTALAIVASLLAVVGWVVAARQWARANAERVRAERERQHGDDFYRRAIAAETGARIDPDDRDAVGRLWFAYLRGAEAAMDPVTSLQSALREFAAPRPLSPDWAALRLADAKVREASRQAGRWTP